MIEFVFDGPSTLISSLDGRSDVWGYAGATARQEGSYLVVTADSVAGLAQVVDSQLTLLAYGVDAYASWLAAS